MCVEGGEVLLTEVLGSSRSFGRWENVGDVLLGGVKTTTVVVFEVTLKVCRPQGTQMICGLSDGDQMRSFVR